METVAIVGTGLIGASFGLALKASGFRGRILGVSSRSAVAAAIARGAVDAEVSLEEAAAQADLVYLAQPICRIVDTIGKIAPLVRDGALVTDAGSTKARIVEAGRAIQRGRFLGGHPMAGKEKRGAAEAESGLFAGRTYIVTPEAQADLERPAERELLDWIVKIGSQVVVLSPEEHDRIVALTSHLPQLLSTALASVLAERLTRPEHRKAGGPGLIDMTRLAGSSYELWRDILATNAASIDSALAACIERLGQLRAHLTEPLARDVFEAANEFFTSTSSGRPR